MPGHPVRTATIVGASGRTYVINVWAVSRVTVCWRHAYGAPVIAYLKQHHCRAVTRLLATTRVGGRDVGFAQSAVVFAGATAEQAYSAAGNFRTLVSKDGTGNLNDLFREHYRLPAGPSSVPSPDAFDAEAQDNGVTVVDAWYLAGRTPVNDPALVRMAKDIYLQF